MHWTGLQGLDQVPSPRLLVDPQRVKANIARMVEIAGGPERLRPHVKTHKMPAVMELQRSAGITKCKVATAAEAAMAAEAGTRDILWAYPLVGPNIAALRELTEHYPASSFAATVDHAETLPALAEAFSDGFAATPLRVFIDVDCGMHRTGVALGEALLSLRDAIHRFPALTLAGLHLYDGQIHDSELEARQRKVETIQRQTRMLLSRDGWPAELTIVAGGSPTFPIWAKETDWECSPGTPLLWDIGYGRAYPDLDFEVAAALLTRVVSRPAPDRLCFDLGYKAIASENPLAQRLSLPAFPEAELIGQSEEHLVVCTEKAKDVSIGAAYCALPKHICPTVALHDEAYLVADGAVTGTRWPITARRRDANFA